MQHHWIHAQCTFVRLYYESLLVHITLEGIIHLLKVLYDLVEFLHLLLIALTFLCQHLLHILQGCSLLLEL